MYVVPRFLPVCFGDFNLDPFHENMCGVHTIFCPGIFVHGKGVQ